MDVDDIMAKQVEQLEREKKELNERLRNQEKKVHTTCLTSASATRRKRYTLHA